MFICDCFQFSEAEAPAGSVLSEKVFIKSSQNLQENNCARHTFFNKVVDLSLELY